jgi:cell division protein FtsQ
MNAQAALRRPPPRAAPQALPADVRLMHAVASAVYLLAALGAALAGGLWLMRSPLFPIRAIQLGGELTRNSVPTIRANAGPLLAGNFFSIDLQRSRSAFESVPWVRRAVVRRVWPDRLDVRLEEQHAAALWEGSAEDRGSDRLVNTQGEVFEANVGDVEDDHLPSFAGPDGSAARMLVLYRQLVPVLAPLDLTIARVLLSGRGSWRVELDNDAAIELGRGSDDELLARTSRFVRTLPQVMARYHEPFERADLRHLDGYALRLHGVVTTPALASAAAPRGLRH